MKTFADVEQHLAETLPGYTPRPQQQQLAQTVETALQTPGSRAMLEAGTGVGKSLATLIPGILSGQRVVFATATKALQAQVVDKDLPFLQEKLGLDFTWALLKGRSNFACHAEMASAENWRDHVQPEQVAALSAAYADNPNHVGDYEASNASLAEAGLEGLDERQFSALTVSGDECPGASKCPFGQICLSQKARDKAQQVQVVVANTALLLADSVIYEATAGEVSMLGPYDVQIVDEAHTLEETATDAFASQIRPGTFTALSRELVSLLERTGADHDAADSLVNLGEEFFAALPDQEVKYGRPSTDSIRLRQNWFLENFDLIEKVMVTLRAANDERAAIRPNGDEKISSRKQKLGRRIDNLILTLQAICLDDDFATVRYVSFSEVGYGHNKRIVKALETAPVDVAPVLQRLLWARPNVSGDSDVTTVLVSATLSTGTQGDFTFLRTSLGMDDCITLSVGTPFDYSKQAVTFLPEASSPSPKERSAWMSYSQAATERLVSASGGGALLLFTSRASMRAAYEALSERFGNQGYNCFMQGMPGMSNSQIAEAFVADTNSVLFAMKSFFAGVDFPGDTCRLVVIDKLTFQPPNDPIVQARSEMIESRGGSSFADLAVPLMTLTLTQGYGRLIRTHSDRGVVAILDSRLTGPYWGRKVAKTLPSAPQTTDFGRVEQFYAN